MLLRAMVFLTVGLVCLSDAQQPLRFIAGKKIVAKAHDVPDNLMGGPTRVQTLYAFRGSYRKMVRSADAELLPMGWKKRVSLGDPYTSTYHGRTRFMVDSPYVAYDEPTGWKRTVVIDKDCSRPDYLVASDLVAVKHHRRGWVGISVFNMKIMGDVENRGTRARRRR